MSEIFFIQQLFFSHSLEDWHSYQVAQPPEEIEQEHPGGLLSPDTFLSQSGTGEGSEVDPSEQILTPALQKPSLEERDPRNARLDKKQLLENLVDDLRKRKVKRKFW